MADEQPKKGRSEEEQLRCVFEVLGANLARRQEEFSRRNWSTVTGIKPWRKWSLIVTTALVLTQVVMVYHRLGIANTVGFLVIFIVGCVFEVGLFLTTVINREDLKRETPTETLRTLGAEAEDDERVSRELHKAGGERALERARAKIYSDLGLIEARRNFGTDLLRDIGPAFAAFGIVLKLIGLPPTAYPLLTTAVVLFGACVILIRFAALLALQPHVMRRKKFLVMLEQADVIERRPPND